jgi:hypothetical protein
VQSDDHQGRCAKNPEDSVISRFFSAFAFICVDLFPERLFSWLWAALVECCVFVVFSKKGWDDLFFPREHESEYRQG